jgi:hypothetical protein
MHWSHCSLLQQDIWEGVLGNPQKRFKDFIKQDNWYVAAGLVFLLYIVTSITLRFYFIDTSDMQKILHVLPVIAVFMIIIGYFEKRRMEESDRLKKKKRYEARLEISKFQRELGSTAKNPEPKAEDKNGGGRPESQ